MHDPITTSAKLLVMQGVDNSFWLVVKQSKIQLFLFKKIKIVKESNGNVYL